MPPQFKGGWGVKRDGLEVSMPGWSLASPGRRAAELFAPLP
jgi:hypothetical protein